MRILDGFFYKNYIKRCVDFFFSFAGLVILSPLLLIFVVILKIALKGNVFFIQERVGKNGRIFKLIKFKTMTNETDEFGKLLPDNLRLSKTGIFFRNFSLDELPQLVNIIKGDMSIVGPRPLLPKYLPLYSIEQMRRHEVRPGITGWAQINGRNEISWTRKFELDIWYVNNLSLLLDLRILFMTVKKVLRREGVSKDGFATTEAFNGNN